MAKQRVFLLLPQSKNLPFLFEATIQLPSLSLPVDHSLFLLPSPIKAHTLQETCELTTPWSG